MSIFDDNEDEHYTAQKVFYPIENLLPESEFRKIKDLLAIQDKMREDVEKYRISTPIPPAVVDDILRMQKRLADQEKAYNYKDEDVTLDLGEPPPEPETTYYSQDLDQFPDYNTSVEDLLLKQILEAEDKVYLDLLKDEISKSYEDQDYKQDLG